MTAPQNAGQHFLSLLWGEEVPGLLQTWTLHDKRSEYWPHWRGVHKDGERDVFTAMGTTARALSPRTRASAKQVCAIAGLWLDLDVGPGKLSTAEAALEVAYAHFGPTVVVSSGHGIHAYYLFAGPWIFRSTSEQAEAASLARRFVALHRRRAPLDSVGDLARLMRLPGTLNTKDPSDPRCVHILTTDGPRGGLDALYERLHDVPDPAVTAPTSLFDGPVTLTGDQGAYTAKLEALIANSPEFAAVWDGERVFPSASEADLSLCSLAAGAMTDPELARLIAEHRGSDPKGRRADYVARTIRRARSTPQPSRRAA